MSLTFSIAAPQSVTLPDGQVLHFRVNTADSSLCEIHVAGKQRDEAGTHILVMKRNGAPVDDTFVVANFPVPEVSPGNQPYKSVDDEPVRADDWRNPATKPAGTADAKPVGQLKVDPVHGAITTAGADQNAGKPREARLEDASRADIAERASVGIPPKSLTENQPVDGKPVA